MAVLMNR